MFGERERDEGGGMDGIVEDTVGDGDERDGVVIVGVVEMITLGCRRAEREREGNGSGLGEVKRKRRSQGGSKSLGKYT
jgi:hypothetical protein